MTLSARAFVAIALFLCLGTAHGQSRSEIYALQEKCGKRAEQVFDKDFPTDQRKGLENYENHYNVQLNRCFMVEENTFFIKSDGRNVLQRLITFIDVNDNKSIGNFSF